MTTIDKAIDPARVGLSKSMMGSPCERKSAYGEFVRDAAGRRLRFPMPERVIFGSALDSAIGYIAWHMREDGEFSIDAAEELGMERAQGESCSEAIDWDTFAVQLRNALEFFIETPLGRPGLHKPIDWLYGHTHEPGFRIQGDDGESLHAGDVIGTPDFMCRHVIDLKSTARRYSDDKFTNSAEMPIYALLYAAHHDGTLPESLIYLVYHRVSKPYWDVYEETATADHVALGRLYANRWRTSLATGDPEAFAFDTKFCGDCGFRNAIPEVGFDGCAVGQLVPQKETAA